MRNDALVDVDSNRRSLFRYLIDIARAQLARTCLTADEPSPPPPVTTATPLMRLIVRRAILSCGVVHDSQRCDTPPRPYVPHLSLKSSPAYPFPTAPLASQVATKAHTYLQRGNRSSYALYVYGTDSCKGGGHDTLAHLCGVRTPSLPHVCVYNLC